MLIGNNMTHKRGGFPLFKDISFSLKKGEIIAIQGPNGSGKSTLLRMLAGLIAPQPQTLFWEKKEITARNVSIYQQELQYSGHKLALHPEARVKDQIYLWKDLYGMSAQSIDHTLEDWGIAPFKNKKIAHLSHGQQKRLSLSRCAWLKRPLWILDEPESGLDQQGKEILLQSLSKHIEKGGLAVIATHESILLRTTTVISLENPHVQA